MNRGILTSLSRRGVPETDVSACGSPYRLPANYLRVVRITAPYLVL